MFEQGPLQTSCKYPLEELLRDSDFLKIIDLLTKEVMWSWSVPTKVARGFVLSAIGEPQTLARIYNAWLWAKHNGKSLGPAKLLIRRHVIDLVRRDARPQDHASLPAPAGAVATPPGSLQDLLQHTPRAQAKLQHVIHMVQRALPASLSTAKHNSGRHRCCDAMRSTEWTPRS